MGLFRHKDSSNTILVEDEKKLKKERENIAFKKSLQEITGFLRNSKPFTSKVDFEKKMLESGLVYPDGHETYDYALQLDEKNFRSEYPNRKIMINGVPFVDGKKQVKFILEFRDNLDKLPCFFHYNQRDEGIDPTESEN